MSWSLEELTPETVAGAQDVMRRSIADDFGDNYDPAVHADVDDPLGHYAPGAGPFLLVAVDDDTGEVVATGGMRDGRLRPGLVPEHLLERYERFPHGQIVRVYVRRDRRRRGIAGAITRAVLDRVATEGRYPAVSLHTYRHSPGAVAFWDALGAVLVFDDTDGPTGAVFYELPTINTSHRGEFHGQAS